MDQTLLERTEAFVERYFREHLSPRIYYHSIEHTRAVVRATEDIGRHAGLDPATLEGVMLAAWLHDTGYGENGPHDHETASRRVARQFLEGEEYDPKRLEKVLDCIEATRMPQNPQSLPEQVLCDADLCHLASDTYFDWSDLLRKEMVAVQGCPIKQNDWLGGSRAFFEAHEYHTPYAREHLTPMKEKNLAEIERKLEEAQEKEEEEGVDVVPATALKKLKKKLKKAKKKSKKYKQKSESTRSVDSMFRTVSKNHIDLSSIADNKANIMISVNAIIVSILVSVLLRKFDEYPHLIIPTMILITVCLVTIVFAILATRPNVTVGRFEREDVEEKRANLLFFGNFHRMSLEEYDWGVREMIKDKDFVYSSMIRDIYFLGAVLGKKYRLLRICYTIFMFGFIISVISFAVAVLFFPPANY
ncbi:MAG: Pycsar system effector family protein [Catalinimonas sp.]